MNTLLQDLRYAFRKLGRSPGFTTLAVLTLALGIGAATAIFSVVRGVLLEPLPYPEPERLTQVWQVGAEGNDMSWSEPNFRDVRELSRSFEALGAYGGRAYTVVGAQEAARVAGAVVSDGFFPALGVQPMLGRSFLPEEIEGAAPVAIIGHGYWQTSLAGDPEALGGTIRLDDREYTIVGIMPPGLAFPAEAQLWLPREIRGEQSRTAHNWRAIGRLADGVTVAQAQTDLDAIATRLKEQYGDDTWMSGAAVVPLHEELVGSVRPALLILLGAAGLLLLIACANVANLLLAQATTRGREMAVRLALGAGRGRLPRQLLVESAVLTFAGGAAGAILAFWGVDALLAFEPGRLPRVDGVGVDWAVLAFALLVAAVAALGIGLAAALRATKADVRDALSEGGRGGSGGREQGRLRSALVAGQVALTVVLLVGGGLLARSFLHLINLDPGYRTGGAVVMELALPGPAAGQESDDPLVLGTPNRRGAALLQEITARIGALPGTGAVGGVNALPLAGGGANGMFLVQNHPGEITGFDDWARISESPERVGFADYRVATPGYFEAMEIPLLSGRLFTESDAQEAQPVAVISRALAETEFPGQDPLGKLIQFGNMDGDLHPFLVVGVVGDVRDRSLEAEPTPVLYGNALQRTTMLGGRFMLVSENAGPPAAVIASARSIAQQLAPEMPVRFRTLDEIFSASLADRRFSLLLLGVFGVTALLLAAMGLYGVVSYLVARRTREIGIRLALGARQASVLRLMVRHGLILTFTGVAIGLVGSYAATRVLASQLYGIGTMDPLTFAGVVLVLCAISLLASYVPARRAARVDPIISLRAE